MKKIIVNSVLLLFICTTASFSGKKLCSEHNKITHYKLYKECINKHKGIKQNKAEKVISGVNSKYKNLRDKTPKTGVEMWKKYKKNKQ